MALAVGNPKKVNGTLRVQKLDTEIQPASNKNRPQETNGNPQQADGNMGNLGNRTVAPEKDPGMAKKLQGSGLKGKIKMRLYGKKG